MAGILFAAILAGLGSALVVWLALRTRAATLQERLAGREAKIAELEARIGEEMAALSRAESELARLREEQGKLETRLVEERKAASEKLGLLNETQAKLSDAFKALSSEALKSNNESFLNLARATLEKFQEGARNDLEKRQSAIDQLVKPVRETLQKFDTKIGEIEKARLEAYGGLTQQVRGLADSQQTLQRETSNLVKALGSPRVRGRWGEVQLHRVVEIAGMLEFCDFDQQVHVADDDGGVLRPDLVVRLPGGKSVVVDAKTPMAAYLEAIEAPDEATRKAKLIEHARSIREHMNSLGKKAYWEQFQPAPEFVVLFFAGRKFLQRGAGAGADAAGAANGKEPGDPGDADDADRAAARLRLRLAAGGAGGERAGDQPARARALRPDRDDERSSGQARRRVEAGGGKLQRCDRVVRTGACW